MRSIYPVLDKALAEKSMTYTDLAEAVGVSHMGMYRRLRGITQFRLPEVIYICQLFPGYTVAELFCAV